MRDEPSQSFYGRNAGAALRGFPPPPALCGFLLLLTLMFTVAYIVGTHAGPVAPGMQGTANTINQDETGYIEHNGGMDMDGEGH
ncbi:hypothetical protein ACIPSE_44280 [Streptomyces sp. NPDC090106]|uniref:hypothetical protein n=1 Tax=Streptomyces sp. NPDC090106 TaxID=3365946 RepID=UPI003824BA86